MTAPEELRETPVNKGIPYQWLGFFTPILLLLGAFLLFSGGMIVGRFAGRFSIVVGPPLGYFVSLKLCRWVGASGGRPAFKLYVKNTLLGFIFWPILWLPMVVFFGSMSDGNEVVDGGQSLGIGLAAISGLMAFGVLFLCWAIAAAWCWRSTSDQDRPSGHEGGGTPTSNS